MTRMVVLLLLVLVASAEAQIMRCDQQPNLACAISADTLIGPITIGGTAAGNTPLIFDGTTAGGNTTTVSVVNPTGARTLVVPDANSATATLACTGGAACSGSSLPCAAGNHISSFDVTTGAFTCSADSGGSGHAMLSATHTDSVGTGIAPISGDLLYGNSTPKWDRFPRGIAGDVLQTSGSTLVWAPISNANIGPGALSNVVKVNQTLTGTWPNLTLPSNVTSADNAVLRNNGVTLDRVGTCVTPFVNTYTLTPPNTVVMCESANPGSPGNVVIASIIVL